MNIFLNLILAFTVFVLAYAVKKLIAIKQGTEKEISFGSEFKNLFFSKKILIFQAVFFGAIILIAVLIFVYGNI